MGGRQLELYIVDVERAHWTVRGRDALRRSQPSRDAEINLCTSIQQAATAGQFLLCMAWSRFLPGAFGQELFADSSPFRFSG